MSGHFYENNLFRKMAGFEVPSQMERGYGGFSLIFLVLSALIRCIRVIRVPFDSLFGKCVPTSVLDHCLDVENRQCGVKLKYLAANGGNHPWWIA
jgi:hypothetical protein